MCHGRKATVIRPAQPLPRTLMMMLRLSLVPVEGSGIGRSAAAGRVSDVLIQEAPASRPASSDPTLQVPIRSDRHEQLVLDSLVDREFRMPFEVFPYRGFRIVAASPRTIGEAARGQVF